MSKQYISKLRALSDYILQFQNRTPVYKRNAAKSSNDFLRNIIKGSQQKGLDDSIIGDILFKYNNIKIEIVQEYPSIANVLSEKPTYGIVVHEIVYLLSFLKNKTELDIAIKKEGIFLNGQEFDAFLFIGEIISEADTNIRLIDNFINDEVITILSSKKSKEVEVKIITSNRANIDLIKIAKRGFDAQYRNIQIKISENFHDRFVFIDEKYIYHLGCSLRDAGNRTFMFSRIGDPDIINILNKKWNVEWAKNRSI